MTQLTIPSIEEYHFYRLYSMDLGDARETLALVERYDEPVVRHCILSAAIVSYARPFSGNHGKLVNHGKWLGTHRLSGDDYIARGERALHDELLDLRNGMFAHTDHELRDPSINRWHTNEGQPIYFLRYRVVPWESLLARVSDIDALIRAVELRVEGWVQWFERQYGPLVP